MVKFQRHWAVAFAAALFLCVRSIDILSSKEYTYTYEEGRIVRATESTVQFSGEIVTSKTVTNTVRYVYDSEGTLTKKIVTPATGTAQTTYYETTDDITVVKFKVVLVT